MYRKRRSEHYKNLGDEDHIFAKEAAQCASIKVQKIFHWYLCLLTSILRTRGKNSGIWVNISDSFWLEISPCILSAAWSVFFATCVCIWTNASLTLLMVENSTFLAKWVYFVSSPKIITFCTQERRAWNLMTQQELQRPGLPVTPQQQLMRWSTLCITCVERDNSTGDTITI